MNTVIRIFCPDTRRKPSTVQTGLTRADLVAEQDGEQGFPADVWATVEATGMYDDGDERQRHVLCLYFRGD